MLVRCCGLILRNWRKPEIGVKMIELAMAWETKRETELRVIKGIKRIRNWTTCRFVNEMHRKEAEDKFDEKNHN